MKEILTISATLTAAILCVIFYIFISKPQQTFPLVGQVKDQITVDENTYTVEYADDFSNEDITIKSDRDVYSGLNIPIVFSVTNNAVSQDITVSFMAAGNVGVAFERYEPSVNRPFTTYECLGTVVATTTDEMSWCDEDLTPIDHDNFVSSFTPIQRDAIDKRGSNTKPLPQGHKLKGSFTTTFQANETRYFRLILQSEQVQDEKREFTIEATGSISGYGQLK